MYLGFCEVSINMRHFESIWNNGIVSFDTCSLGRMYEWESLYAVNIKDAMSYLYKVGKLWETEICINEFLEQKEPIQNNIHKIKYESGILKNLKKRPIPWNKIDSIIQRWESKGFSEQFTNEIARLRGKKQITEEEFNVIHKMSHKSIINIDVENLFNKILIHDGLSLSEGEKNNIQKRYDSGMRCPGSEDRKKKNGNKYNDLYIWELLKKKAKTEMVDIIFVTVDHKEDWFDDNKPREEYINEFIRETGQRILIMTLSEFWNECQLFLEMSVDDFIKYSNIKEQIEDMYDDFYHPDIIQLIEELLLEKDDIKDILEDEVDCCVDMPVLDELGETVVEKIEVIDFDDDGVYINVFLNTTAFFEAMNYTDHEYWSAGSGSISLSIVASANIPIIWSSEDTERKVLDKHVFVSELLSISVDDNCKTYDYVSSDIDGSFLF